MRSVRARPTGAPGWHRRRGVPSTFPTSSPSKAGARPRPSTPLSASRATLARRQPRQPLSRQPHPAAAPRPTHPTPSTVRRPCTPAGGPSAVRDPRGTGTALAPLSCPAAPPRTDQREAPLRHQTDALPEHSVLRQLRQVALDARPRGVTWAQFRAAARGSQHSWLPTFSHPTYLGECRIGSSFPCTSSKTRSDDSHPPRILNYRQPAGISGQ